ncbi:MAG TPA: DUF1109 domain-containing protein [Kiritimatiellia bacterium]|nr:DUF1109 domain-containing protein [Kiritimatiellia bacterium]HMP34866.1 DUF1109 domain-containing protein [Kiritimatiellia bacterium]
MKTDDVISRLAAEVAPVRRLPAPGVQWAVWLGISLAYLGAFTAVSGVRGDLAAVVGDPSFIGLTVLFTVMGVLAGYAAFVTSVPDRDLPAGVRWSLLLASGISLGWLGLLGGTTPGCAPGHGLACAVHIFLLGILPTVVLVVALKRAAPANLVGSGILIGLALNSLGAAALQFACDNQDPLHLLVWHWLPGVVFAFAGILLARRFLRW